MTEMRLIDANALKEHLGIDGDRKYINKIAHETSDYIDEMPTIDATPVVHGRWIRANDGQAFFDVEYVCSGCQFVVAVSGIGTPILYGYKFCPNCGAKMDGGAGDG